MTLITLSYPKNPGRDIVHSEGGYCFRVTRASGRDASSEEVEALLREYSQAYIGKQIRIDYSGSEPCPPGTYRIDIARNDGLPLMDSEVEALMMTEMLKRRGTAPTPIVSSPLSVLEVVAELDISASRAWLLAMGQLEPECEPQLVHIPDRLGAVALVDAGLMEPYGDSVDDRYMIPRAIADCTWP